MTERLGQYDGIPPDAVADRRVTPTVYTWQFADDLMVEYIVTDDGTRPRGWWDIGRFVAKWLYRPMRAVLVIGLYPGPVRR